MRIATLAQLAQSVAQMEIPTDSLKKTRYGFSNTENTEDTENGSLSASRASVAMRFRVHPQSSA